MTPLKTGANKNEFSDGRYRVSLEGQLYDQKSLRAVTGKTADWNEIAKDCIAFANATGGRLLLGIEDGQHAPPADQHVPSDLPDTLRRKLAQRTVNVSVLPDVVTASNGGQYIELRIPRAIAVASTTDGRYFLRVADQSKPVTGGVLCLGRQHHRAQLTTAPVIQFIKYDEYGQKVNKLVWDDYTQSPKELIEAVWLEVPDFRERYELPDGLYRQNVPAFDEIVVRELLVNALVHRPYTQRGDIFLNLHPDRLEMVNPGPLPLGVTPQNVLHTTVRRNEHLARLFHDLKLMEREGSGFDKIFEVLLSQGRPMPELIETHDRVQVTVHRRILKPEVIDFIAKADLTYQLTQRERIALGLLAQHDALTARELADTLELLSVEALQPWLKRLLDWHLVQSAGRTQAKRYFVDPSLLRSLKFTGETTLKRIEPHRLAALVLEDLERYPQSAISEIHQRIGGEIHPKQVKRALEELIERGAVRFEGNNRWRRYWATS